MSIWMYKEQVFQGSKGQSSTRLLEVDFIMCRSLKLVLVFFLVMIMIEHSSSWVMIYRKLKPVEPLSSPLDHENKVRTMRIKKIVLIFNVSIYRQRMPQNPLLRPFPDFGQPSIPLLCPFPHFGQCKDNEKLMVAQLPNQQMYPMYLWYTLAIWAKPPNSAH